jgi:hypothetical protein
MASLILSEFTYESGSGAAAYRFTVIVDAQGQVSVRNIQNPFGLIMDPWSQVPKSVSDDICTATAQVENILATTSAVNGTLTFAGGTQQSVTFSTPFSDTSYRVQLTSDTFVPLRVINKTTTGFTVDAGAAFTGTVGYDVFA